MHSKLTDNAYVISIQQSLGQLGLFFALRGRFAATISEANRVHPSHQLFSHVLENHIFQSSIHYSPLVGPTLTDKIIKSQKSACKFVLILHNHPYPRANAFVNQLCSRRRQSSCFSRQNAVQPSGRICEAIISRAKHDAYFLLLLLA